MGVLKGLLFPGGQRVRIVQAAVLGFVLIRAADDPENDLSLGFVLLTSAWTLMLMGAGATIFFGLLDAQSKAQYLADGRFARDVLQEVRS